MDKPKLYVLVGLSGSGKSTLAAQLAENDKNTIVVSSDAIREELMGKVEDQSRNNDVFKIFHNRIRENLKKGKNVVADATNITIKSRRAILNIANGTDVDKICILCAKPFELCKHDNAQREHPVPDSVLDKQIRRFQIPFYEEGWDEIKISTSYVSYQLGSIADVLNKMVGFDQKNPHHNKALHEHGAAVLNQFMRFTDCDFYVFAALIHDVGKLYTQTFDENGIAHYFGHESVGAYLMMEKMINEPRFNKNAVLECCFLINYHMLPFGWNTEAAKKRWRKIFGEDKYLMLTRFHECDIKE